MASEAIRIPCRLWPHRTKNRNASYDHLVLTQNDIVLAGIKCPDNVVSDVCFKLVQPIDQTPNATPNVKVRLALVTSATGTNNFRFLLGAQKVVRGTTAVDFTASFAAFTVASAGAGIEKTLDLTISGTTFALNDMFEGVIRREGSDAGDGIVGDVFITEAVVFMDT